jgi:two-component system, NarL family, invasion response regulator UvrY
MYRFLLVEDHIIFRQGVKKVIIDALGEVFFGEAGNSGEAITKLHKDKWDLVILDINMPGRSGLDLIHEIKSFDSTIPILVLSMYEEDQMALRALKAGAKGYLTKTRASEDMIIAITRILDGKDYISETVSGLLVQEFRKDTNRDAVKVLSDREYFVLLRLAGGETVTEISKTLALSVKTISTYRTRVMKKLNLKNMVDLIRFVKENDIVLK